MQAGTGLLSEANFARCIGFGPFFCDESDRAAIPSSGSNLKSTGNTRLVVLVSANFAVDASLSRSITKVTSWPRVAEFVKGFRKVATRDQLSAGRYEQTRGCVISKALSAGQIRRSI